MFYFSTKEGHRNTITFRNIIMSDKMFNMQSDKGSELDPITYYLMFFFISTDRWLDNSN